MTDTDKRARFADAALPVLDDVYGLALALMRNPALAELAVQECYRRALEGFDHDRALGVKPWLLAIARRICTEELARCGPQGVRAEPGRRRDPGRQLLRSKRRPSSGSAPAMRQRIDELPPPLREVLILRELNGLPYREIADVVDVPIETVMVRLARARALLLGAGQATDAEDVSSVPAVC